MPTVSSSDIPSLFDLLPTDWEILLLGEMHGSKQNAPLIKEVAAYAAQYHPLTCAFEWALDAKYAESLRKYVAGGVAPSVLPQFFLDSDGRFTHEHIALLKWFREWNSSNTNAVELLFFDAVAEKDEVPEKKLADTLLEYKKENPSRRIIVETGVFHAKTTDWNFDGEVHTPMGVHLAQYVRVASFFLLYPSGSIRVDGDALNVTDAELQISPPQEGFDAHILMPASTPTKPIQSLTNLQEWF